MGTTVKTQGLLRRGQVLYSTSVGRTKKSRGRVSAVITLTSKTNPTSPPTKVKPLPKVIPRSSTLQSSDLKVFDIPDELLIDHTDNPNEQDDATFDRIVQGIRTDGFDEPLIVVPSLKEQNKYIIVSGHHRRKAGKVAGMVKFPCVIKSGWDQDKVDMELVARNIARGKINPQKFTLLVDKLRKKGYDEAIIQAQMGFTQSDAFEKLYKRIEQSLPKAARKKLAEAKENIKSVDGLSSVLNKIFTEHGSDLNHGFMVFDFGGKTHHYVPTDKMLDKYIEKLEQRCRDENLSITDVFKHLLQDTNSIPVKKIIKIKPGKPKVVVSIKPNGEISSTQTFAV